MKEQKRILRRLRRIESKCDRIIAMLMPRRSATDTVIDRMHRTARQMRKDAYRELEEVLRHYGR